MTRPSLLASTLSVALLLFMTGPFITAASPSGGRSGTVTSPEDVASNFDLQKLADGVYAVIRKDPTGLMVDANDVFVINDNDVIVIDTNGAPSTTRAVLSALRKLTSLPVTCVINTHWHDDHIRGNKIYREAFPDVEFIGHAKMREYLPTTGAANRKDFLQRAPSVVAQMKTLLEKSKSFTGAELTPEERTSYESDIRLAELAIAEGPVAETVLPTLTVEDRLTLYRGNRVIDIRHVGNGHTTGDLVVHLPNEGILITGDLVVWPVPLVGAEQSRIGDWIKTLDRLREFKARTIVPGHGVVLHDDAYLNLMHDLFASVKEQVDQAVARGETLEEVRKGVDLTEFRKRFAGDSAVRKLLFDVYVTSPSVTAAFHEASARQAR